MADDLRPNKIQAQLYQGQARQLHVAECEGVQVQHTRGKDASVGKGIPLKRTGCTSLLMPCLLLREQPIQPVRSIHNHDPVCFFIRCNLFKSICVILITTSRAYNRQSETSDHLPCEAAYAFLKF